MSYYTTGDSAVPSATGAHPFQWVPLPVTHEAAEQQTQHAMESEFWRTWDPKTPEAVMEEGSVYNTTSTQQYPASIQGENPAGTTNTYCTPDQVAQAQEYIAGVYGNTGDQGPEQTTDWAEWDAECAKNAPAGEGGMSTSHVQGGGSDAKTSTIAKPKKKKASHKGGANHASRR